MREGVCKGMGLLDRRYVQYFYYRYSELNPVGADMVAWPDAYHWSRYRSNTLVESNVLVTRHDLYSQRVERWCSFVELAERCLPTYWRR